MFDPEIHHRRSIRLTDYDYATAGYYFVTICVQHKEPLLGEIVAGEMIFTEAGAMVRDIWTELPIQYPGIAVDVNVVMPNHFHGIIILQPPPVGAGPRACPDPERVRACPDPERVRACPDPERVRGEGHPQGGTGISMSLADVVHRFKSLTTNRYIHGVKQNNWPPFPGRFWQRNYHERIIRNQTELHNIRQYIRDNPKQWEADTENPLNTHPVPPQ